MNTGVPAAGGAARAAAGASGRRGPAADVHAPSARGRAAARRGRVLGAGRARRAARAATAPGARPALCHRGARGLRKVNSETVGSPQAAILA